MKFKAILLSLLSLLVVGCNGLDTELLESEQKKMISFLTSKHNPRLIAESEVAESLEENPAFYSEVGRYAYRYIQDYYNANRASQVVLKQGDRIAITFWCHDFSSYSVPSNGNLYFTNDEQFRQGLTESGLNVEYWSFEPKIVTLGAGDILSNIEGALVGCRVGDTVEVYLSSNLAYGDKWVGVTNLEAPMAFVCKIISVEK